MNDLPLRPTADLGAVEDRFFTLRNFPLTDGTISLRASATIIVLRVPRRLSAVRARYHSASALSF